MMNGPQLLARVQFLREEGRSIRAIATELGVHPSRVQRALKRLDSQILEESVAVPAKLDSLFGPEAHPLIGRQREINELNEALDEVLSGRGHIAMLVG
jgi:IS30 family transposase